MRLSISNIAWNQELDPFVYPALKEKGYQGLEIAPTRIFPDHPYDDFERAREWAALLWETYQLKVSSMQSIWYGRQEKIFGSEADRRALIEYTKKAVRFAEAVGCGNLVFGNPRNRDTEDVVGNMPVAKAFFHEIGEYALEHHTVIALEANPVIYNTHFVNTTEQAVQMVYDARTEGMKVNVDLGTMIYNGEDIDYLRTIPEYINHVHISEPNLVPVTVSSVHAKLFEALRTIHYDRYVSIEMRNSRLSVVFPVLDKVRGL